MDLEDLRWFQRERERRYRPDLMRLDQAKQVEDSSIRLAKLACLAAPYREKTYHGEPCSTDALIRERVPSILVFALKFANRNNLGAEVTYLARIHDFQQRKKARRPSRVPQRLQSSFRIPRAG